MPKKKLPERDFEWTPELAYSVGLITTDGNLSIDKRHITVTSTDIQLLETFQKCLGIKAKISPNPPSKLSKKPAFRIQYGNVVFYNWLLKIGLFPRKSLTLGILNIEDKYFPDFLRGHLDGDGSIIYYKDKYNTKINPKYIYDRLFVYFRSASPKHIEWLQKSVANLRGVKGSINYYHSKSQLGKSFSYILKYSTKEAKIILKWIYYQDQLPCLLRKLVVAKPFI